MRKKLLLTGILTLLFLSGCSCKEKVKYVYLTPKCPKLQSYEYNIIKTKPLTLHIKVKDANKTNR